MSVAYLNGRFVPFADAALPLHDAGFVSGATVVDNARTYGRELFRWPDHLARFRRDCAACYVPLNATDDELTAIATELVARNGALLPADGELQVVTFATPGPLGFYVGEPANGPPTLGMVSYPVPDRYRRFAEQGVVLAVAGTHGSSRHLLPPRVKHRSRMMWHVADNLVRAWATPGAVPVVLSEEGSADTPIGGVLLVAGDEVYFPRGAEVLDSITAKVAEELCDRLGLPTNTLPEGHFNSVGHSRRADELDARTTEMILAGTGFGLVGVREFWHGPVTSRRYPVPGPVLTRLRAAWADTLAGSVRAVCNTSTTLPPESPPCRTGSSTS
ncbi:MAG TPA: aminotransferase class IV [Urbifossiella sp.]|nr:aminotransferase class IV [Urbifossiella sp.]